MIRKSTKTCSNLVWNVRSIHDKFHFYILLTWSNAYRQTLQKIYLKAWYRILGTEILSYDEFHCKGLFIWRWTGPVKRTGLLRWDDIYPTFTWDLLSQFNQKVCYVAGKTLFDQIFFTTRWRKAIMQNKCSYII